MPSPRTASGSGILKRVLNTTRPTDQLTCAAEIKKDMEKPHPMDRLLCGDVGVGKTEVALRAAFKCIMGGKQVAMLVPTTILAWQHYTHHSLPHGGVPRQSGAALPLSPRPKQQKETLKGLAAGTVDVVVGTHRLLQKDVKFHGSGPCHHRRGAALRRQAQGKAEGEFHRRGHADAFGHAHPAHAEHGHERPAGHEHHRRAAL